MTRVIFYLKYSTRFGQSIFLVAENGDAGFTEMSLQYMNEQYWKGEVVIDTSDGEKVIHYRYNIKEDGRASEYDYWPSRTLEILPGQTEVQVFDEWQHIQFGSEVFRSRAFARLLKKHKSPRGVKSRALLNFKFNVHVPLLPEGKAVCLCGSLPGGGDWDKKSFLKMSPAGPNTWTASLFIHENISSLEFKYGVYDSDSGSLVCYEDGPNRLINDIQNQTGLNVFNQFAIFCDMAWKGCGINIQLSSLRSARSWGVGDFSDLKMFTDWSAALGMKMIQLLPVNDTTSTHSDKDSYPYSAISAFALHPIFLDVAKIARAAKIKLNPEYVRESLKLNEADSLQYEQVLNLKLRALRDIFEKERDKLSCTDGFREFFGKHHYWLMPYAAFCFLRDKYGSSDNSLWREYAVYDQKKTEKLAAETSPEYPELLFHYFVQFHLDKQLNEAVRHAHRNGMIMKGDLPIGVGRNSVDTWMNPELFHLGMQAGAPPDAFTAKGQNWSFPTYNWEAMQAGHYAWWRKRLQQMSHYFDAIRIDHVLGFFRIWSVPLHAIEGILGHFVPALPLSKNDFINEGLHFDETRFCEPFIDGGSIDSLFGPDAEWFREFALQEGKLIPELGNQRDIDKWCVQNGIGQALRQKLLDLSSEVILLRDEERPDAFHFRINMADTFSFRSLPQRERGIMEKLYLHYFFEKQNELWFQSAQSKLDAIQHGSDMMVCAEDLGMVPEMVEGVLRSREMLALQVERMPKVSGRLFSDPSEAPYLSVVTPSTHDMSTIREWWEEDTAVSRQYYHESLGCNGEPPFYCEPEVCNSIIKRHMESPAMWAVFLLQDLFAIQEETRREIPANDRINNPADPDHFWNYRMHITIEQLLKAEEFNNKVKSMIADAGR